VEQVANKEIIILGKALKALLELNAIDKVREIVDIMANSETKADLLDSSNQE